MINYDDRYFRSLSNSASGEVDSETIFHYRQQGQIVWGTYSGGSIRFGTLIANVDDQGCLDMRYQHINDQGKLMTGICRSVPEVLPNGQLRLHESWQWTSGDHSKGDSIVEELASFL